MQFPQMEDSMPEWVKFYQIYAWNCDLDNIRIMSRGGEEECIVLSEIVWIAEGLSAVVHCWSCGLANQLHCYSRLMFGILA